MRPAFCKPRQTLLLKAALFFGSLTLSLIAAECALRVFDPVAIGSVERGAVRLSQNPDLLYELNPHFHDHNSAGFRGDVAEQTKPNGVLRVLALGDSLAYGLYMEDEETFPRQLEKLLRQNAARFPDAREFEVLNFGVPGYSILQETEQLETIGLAYDPDIALLTVCLNDWEAYTWDFAKLIESQDSAGRMHTFSYYDPSRPLLRRCLLASHLFRKTYYFFRGLRSETESLAPEGNPYEAHYKSGDFFRDRFIHMAALLADRQIALAVALIPYRGDDQAKQDQYTDKLQELKALQLEADFALIDFKDFAKRRLSDEAKGDGESLDSVLFEGMDFIHLSATGYAMLAEAYFEAIQESHGFAAPARQTQAINSP